MARVKLIGFEVGDISETGGALQTGFTVDSTVNTGYGLYSLKATGGTATNIQVYATLSPTMSRVRLKFYFRCSNTTPPATGFDRFPLMRFFDVTNTLMGQVIYDLNSPSTQQFRFQDAVGGSTTAAVSLTANQWYRIEMDFTVGVGTGACQVWLDGVSTLNVTGATTGAVNCTYLVGGWTPGGQGLSNGWWDDLEVDDAVVPGVGYVIARQFMAGTPTYDAWIKNGGATIDAVWDDTPFSTARSATSFTAAAAQTGLIYSFSTTQTGHGNGIADGFDTINAAKVGFVAKTAATTAAGITQVGTSQVSSVLNGADITLTFSTAPQAGDVVYVWGGHFTRASTNIGPSTAGYTAVGGPDTSTNNQSFGVWRKVMGATPDTAVTCQGTGNAADSTAYQSIVLRQVDTGTPEDATPTKATATTGAPDPAAIVSVTDNAWILAVAGSQVSDATVGTQASYTQNGAANSNDTNPMTIAGSFLTTPTTAGSFNPPAWSSWSNGNYVAFTIAVRPATEAGSAASIRRRLGGSDTDTAITLTTTDVYYEVAPFTATLANLNTGEAGVLHGSSSITQTVESGPWVQISFTPVQGLMGQILL